MNSNKILILFCILLSAWLAVPLTHAVVVSELRVEKRGDSPVEENSVLAYASLKVGDEFNPLLVSQDIKALQKTGRYSFVEATYDRTADGVIITYVVQAKPRIRRLRIAGAESLGNKKVRELLDLGVGDLVDDATLAVASQNVLEEYHKKFFPFVEIDWVIEEDPETALADVEIEVDEGNRAGVRQIVFEGREAIPAKDLLKVMKQRRRNWLSWLTGTGTYRPDDLSMDLGGIKQVYLDHGFLDVEVGTPIVEQTSPKRIKITIPVYEGEPYKIGGVDLRGVTIFSEDQVESRIRLVEGAPASMSAIRNGAQGVRDYYGKRGYIETWVRPDINASPETREADIVYDVREGSLAYIRDINIEGNSRTQDKVIRRELAVYPGEIFDEIKVRTSERRLQNLGFFSYVGSSYQSTLQPDFYDLTFEVEEQRTGQFMVGAGFSSIDELIAFVELSQGNFDLLGWPSFTGAGQKIKMRAQFGTQRTDYEISFVEPWFLNRKLSLGVDLFRNDLRFYSDEYDQRNTGGSVSLTRPLTSFDRISLSYTLKDIEVYNVSSNASEIIQREEGHTLQSSMTLTLKHDTRDSYFVPSRGNRTVLSSTLAGGPLGADTDFYRLEARTTQYFPLWFDHVFFVRGWTSVVEEYGSSDDVRIFDRLFLGGARTMRGFKYREVGPMDDDCEPVGGKTAAFGSAEYEIPIWSKLRVAAFYDIGMVWPGAYDVDGKLNSDFGFGLRINIPGFPLMLNYAWPIEAEECNDRSSGLFSFLIGYIL